MKKNIVKKNIIVYDFDRTIYGEKLVLIFPHFI